MPEISHIIALYTKRNLVPVTLKSIINQQFDGGRELILLDDNSKDDTVAVAREATAGFPTTIIENKDNKGPSVRLNQGAKLAKGKYLHFLDHDDILPIDASQFMYDILEESGADFVYGTWEKTGKKAEELLNEKVSGDKSYYISENPLQTVLNGKFKRMCLLVRREVFEKAGGFDPTIFIQDENLPLRLAAVSSKMAVTMAVVNLVPRGEGNLSDSKTQLNHDRFMAYYNFYQTHKLTEVYKRAVSAGWKQRRDMAGGLGKYSSWQLREYLKTIYFGKKEGDLKKHFQFFSSLQGVLKP